MKQNIPQEIVASIGHFTERAKASIKLEALLSEIGNIEKLDFDDIDNVENRAKSYIDLAENKYRAGLLSEQEYIFHQYHAIVSLIHETRWLNGFYSKELEPISNKMRTIERGYGLSSDEYWAKGNAPPEYQTLDKEYEAILSSKLEDEFIEFASSELAELFVKDRSQLEALSEIGRKSIFVKDDVQRLNELARIYENESKVNESGNAFYSASIMLASAMEARLIAHCIENREEVRNSLLKMGLSNKTLKSKNPLDWMLNTLIEVCSNAGWLPDLETRDFVFISKNIGHTLRNTRNLVHPGKHIKRKAPLTLGEEQFKDMKASYELVSQLLNWPNSKSN
jgi:hypothetical protein